MTAQVTPGPPGRCEVSAAQTFGGSAGFDHTALIVESDGALRRRLLPVLEDHLVAAEPVLMVLAEHTEQVMRDALGHRAGALEWAETGAFDQRLGFVYEGFRRYLQRQHDAGRRVHVIAEPDVRTDLDAPVDRVAASLSYESVSNEEYAAYGCPVTCLWDSRRHPAIVIEEVRSLHEHELTDEGRRRSPTFTDPATYLRGRADVAMTSPPLTVDLDLRLFERADLEMSRAAVGEWSRDCGFSEQASGDMVIATAEVVANGFVHGTPPVRVRSWRHRDTLIVQVDDNGARPVPPAAGYRLPDDVAGGGMGMWLARQLADVVITFTTHESTSVRLYFPHAIMHQDVDPF